MNHKILALSLMLIFHLVWKARSQEASDFSTISEIEETGDYKGALFQVTKQIETDSLNPALWTKAAKLYRLNLKYKQSITAYEKAIRLNPENRKLMVALARVNKLAGKKDEAQKLYLDFLKAEPDNIMALSDLAEIYSSNNMPDSAAGTYQKLCSLDSLNVEYFYRWAFNQWSSGKSLESLDNYRKALLLDSAYLPVIYDLSRIYVKLKMHDSALVLLKKTIIYYPGESGLYAETGFAHFSRGEYELAIPYFEKAIEKGYKSAEAYRRLAISYYSNFQYEKSQEYFEMLIRKDTSDYKICLYLGHIFNALAQPSKGLFFLQKSINLLTPDTMTVATIYSGMADSYGSLGRYDEQINMIKKRQEQLPAQYQSPKYLFEIAGIYDYQIKDKQKALQYYKNYYNEIKNIDWLSQENKNSILARIKTLEKEIK